MSALARRALRTTDRWCAAAERLSHALLSGPTTRQHAGDASPPPPRSRHTIGAYTPVTRTLWEERLASGRAAERAGTRLADPVPKPLRETSCPYPFTSQWDLRELYRNPWGAVRVGRLLEDLDSLAGNVAFSHCDDGDPDTFPPVLATVAVDRISLLKRLTLDADMRAVGRVVWTGHSSMDILIEVIQHGSPSLKAVFTFVARHPETHKAHAINPLVLETDEQKRLWEERQRINDRRREQRKWAEKGSALSEDGRRWADDMLAEARRHVDMPGLRIPNDILLPQTAQSNLAICFPQVTNLDGKIFGGFLMRYAFEVAFSTCHLFAGARPWFVEVDEVSFKKPVEVADLLRFEAVVLHADMHPEDGTALESGGDEWRHHEPRARDTAEFNGGVLVSERDAWGRVHVEVVARRTKPDLRVSETTAAFYFTFDVQVRKGRGLKRVLPTTWEEAERILRYHPGSRI